MKFKYRVKHDGVAYPAGAEVPVGNNTPKEEVKEEQKAEAVKPKAKPKKTSKK